VFLSLAELAAVISCVVHRLLPPQRSDPRRQLCNSDTTPGG
jgi:hypothetical protein